MKIFAEHALDNFFLTRTKQPIIDKNTGELVADCLVQEGRGDRRINSTTQTEHDFLIADLFPDASASLLNEGAHCPVHRAVTDVKQKILKNFSATRRVCDFRMKLQSVEFPLWIFHRGKIAAICGPGDAKTFRQRCYFIAVTVPDIELLA